MGPREYSHYGVTKGKPTYRIVESDLALPVQQQKAILFLVQFYCHAGTDSQRDTPTILMFGFHLACIRYIPRVESMKPDQATPAHEHSAIFLAGGIHLSSRIVLVFEADTCEFQHTGSTHEACDHVIQPGPLLGKEWTATGWPRLASHTVAQTTGKLPAGLSGRYQNYRIWVADAHGNGTDSRLEYWASTASCDAQVPELQMQKTGRFWKLQPAIKMVRSQIP